MVQKNSGSPIFSSTVIATIGRPTLARAVESVLTQDLQMDFEVIVVNDSGLALPVEDWQRSERVTILNTNRRERCFARNSGASIARGAFLHFLDDDDWLLPGALKELSGVAGSNSTAAMVCGTTIFVDRDKNPRWERRAEVEGDAFVKVIAGDWIPLLSCLIKTECFFKAGGYDFRFATFGEGKDLTRRVALQGHFANTRSPVSCVVQDRENSTSNHNLSNAYSVLSRDNILGQKGSFTRMWASAKTAYWRGKLVRAYLTCTVWNLRKGRILHALSRGIRAFAGILLSATNMVSRDFWRALTSKDSKENSLGNG